VVSIPVVGEKVTYPSMRKEPVSESVIVEMKKSSLEPWRVAYNNDQDGYGATYVKIKQARSGN